MAASLETGCAPKARKKIRRGGPLVEMGPTVEVATGGAPMGPAECTECTLESVVRSAEQLRFYRRDGGAHL